MIRLHPHALARMQERGASREEVEETIRHGATFTPNMDEAGSARTSRSMPFGKTGLTETNKARLMRSKSRTEATLS